MSLVIGGTYRPVPPDQINLRDPIYGPRGCTAYSITAVDDRNVLGLGRIDGWDLTAELRPGPKGLTLGDAINGLEELTGRRLPVQHVDAIEMFRMVAGNRALVVQGDADQLTPNYGFLGGHSIALNDARITDGVRQYLVGDPLADAWRWMDADMVERYARKLWGRTWPVAYSRPLRVPSVSVKGAFFEYVLAKGKIVKRKPHRSGGFFALTSTPSMRYWPGIGYRTLIRVTDPDSSFNGWWLEPVRSSTVTYAGEID